MEELKFCSNCKFREKYPWQTPCYECEKERWPKYSKWEKREK